MGVYLLLLPAIKLFRTLQGSDAVILFNKASYYPPALFVIVLVTIALSLCLNVLVFYYSRVDYVVFCVIISMVMGGYLLLLPALKLFRTMQVSDAMALFNKASYYPPALFMIVLVALMI